MNSNNTEENKRIYDEIKNKYGLDFELDLTPEEKNDLNLAISMATVGGHTPPSDETIRLYILYMRGLIDHETALKAIAGMHGV